MCCCARSCAVLCCRGTTIPSHQNRVIKRPSSCSSSTATPQTGPSHTSTSHFFGPGSRRSFTVRFPSRLGTGDQRDNRHRLSPPPEITVTATRSTKQPAPTAARDLRRASAATGTLAQATTSTTVSRLDDSSFTRSRQPLPRRFSARRELLTTTRAPYATTVNVPKLPINTKPKRRDPAQDSQSPDGRLCACSSSLRRA